MPPTETRIGALQRKLVNSPNDPHLYLELARAFAAMQCRNEAVGAYLSAARAFERMDSIGSAADALGALLALEPHHQYARQQFARLSALAAFTEADERGPDVSAATPTLTAEVSWGQGMMPLATADLEELDGTEPRVARGEAHAAGSSSPVVALNTADLSLVDLAEGGEAALDTLDDAAVAFGGGEAAGSDGVSTERASSSQASPPLRLPGPSLPRPLLEAAAIEAVIPGQEIFSAGEHATDIYQVLDGEVELSWSSARGVEAFARVEAGAFFGETGLLAAGRRALSARVTRAGELARVDRADARALSRRDPDFDRLLRLVYRDRLAALAKTASPLLRGLSDGDVGQLFAVGRPLAIAPGVVVVEGGVRPKGVLLVLLGQLAALDAAGRREQMVTLGQCACQRALFARDSCSHTLQAASFVQLLVVPGSWLLEAAEAKITRYALRQQPDAAG